MALAYEHFKALREKKEIPAELPAEDASRVLNELVTECRQLTMSQLPTSSSKQLCSILFSHEGGFISAYSTLSEPKVTKDRAAQKKSFNLIFILVSLLVAVAGVYVIWNSGAKDRFIYCLFAVAAEALALLGFFLPRSKANYRV
ncbi:MAG: hypothetical protein II920_07715, partial [Clostridia bacterium]|nr:hypothetical protein [Clostridia bacterium]